MRWRWYDAKTRSRYRRFCDKRRGWYRYFAWKPVMCTLPGTGPVRWIQVWMEWVERRIVRSEQWGLSCYAYRIPGTEHRNLPFFHSEGLCKAFCVNPSEQQVSPAAAAPGATSSLPSPTNTAPTAAAVNQPEEGRL